MIDREFTEVDLRRMLELAMGLREDVVDGRWLVETWHLGHPWAVIVEPDVEPQRLAGESLYTMFVMGWFSFLTIPSGLVAAVVFLIIVLVSGRAKRTHG